jgi:hypothetical protein
VDSEHHSRVDGLDATWRVIHHQIRIVKVHSESDQRDVTFAPGTDLVDARQLHKRWNRLWDKVRDDFWAAVTPTVHRSTDTRRIS